MELFSLLLVLLVLRLRLLLDVLPDGGLPSHLALDLGLFHIKLSLELLDLALYGLLDLLVVLLGLLLDGV